MIPEAVVTRIRALLTQGELSQRKIAVQTGVSRGTVNAIAQGKRPEGAVRRQRQHRDFVPPGGLPRRCPSCGALVQMPCLACQLRAMKRRQPQTMQRRVVA